MYATIKFVYNFYFFLLKLTLWRTNFKIFVNMNFGGQVILIWLCDRQFFVNLLTIKTLLNSSSNELNLLIEVIIVVKVSQNWKV